jgi:hypothetical protein
VAALCATTITVFLVELRIPGLILTWLPGWLGSGGGSYCRHGFDDLDDWEAPLQGHGLGQRQLRLLLLLLLVVICWGEGRQEAVEGHHKFLRLNSLSI